MRKGLLVAGLVALSGMMFAAVGCQQQSSDKYTVEIINKTELQAGEWYPESNGRKIDVKITKNGEEQNATKAIQDGDLKFTTSNAEVAKIQGQMVTPVAVGKTTIAAVYGGQKDTVEVEVSHKPTNKERFGTAHEGNAEDPFTNEDVLKAAAFIKDNGGFDAVEYYVKGEIDSFYHAPGSRGSQCSWYMKPATAGGERFEVYLCEKADKTDWVRTDLWRGAVATAHGPLTYYANGKQYETTSAVLDKVEGTKPADPVVIEATVAEALTVGKALPDGDSSWDDYAVTGYVVKKSGSNFFMASEKGAVAESEKDMLEIYNVSDATVLANLLKDAKVKVTIQLKNYHGQVENTGNGITAAQLEVLEKGGQWEVQKLTVAQALAKIDAIEAPTVEDFGEKTSLNLSVEDGKSFAVSGYVVKKGETWTDESRYKNADFYIADTLEENAPRLQVFRFADKEVFDKLVVNETYVEVTCSLVAYYKLVENVPTLSGKETNAGPEAKIVEAPQPVTANVALTPASLLGYAGENVAYGDGEKTVDGLQVAYVELSCYGNGLQMRTKNEKTTTIYNKNEINIGKLIFNWAASKDVSTEYNKAPITAHMYVEFSNTADFSTLVGEKATVLFTNKIAEVAPTAAAKYFRITQANQGAVYLDSIVVFVAE